MGEPSVINCGMIVYLYCAFLRLHSDLTAWIIEVHCLAEVDSLRDLYGVVRNARQFKLQLC